MQPGPFFVIELIGSVVQRDFDGHQIDNLAFGEVSGLVQNEWL